MYIAITILIFIISIFLVLIVLAQNSKGGGLAANFSSTNQVMGVRKTTDFLEKATWTLAGIIVFLSITSAAFIRTDDSSVAKQSIIKEEVENAVQVDPNINAAPNFQQEAAPQGQTESAPSPTKEAPASK
jgi:preprotein translocase subunit SecG